MQSFLKDCTEKMDDLIRSKILKKTIGPERLHTIWELHFHLCLCRLAASSQHLGVFPRKNWLDGYRLQKYGCDIMGQLWLIRSPAQHYHLWIASRVCFVFVPQITCSEVLCKDESRAVGMIKDTGTQGDSVSIDGGFHLKSIELHHQTTNL